MTDLRSDTVTMPTDTMRSVMAGAEVGDDVYGEDPTVNSLEAFAAELFGKEAAMFVVSGTQSNLCAIMAHCERGDEYIVGQDAHTYKYEAGGAAVLGSIQPQPLEMNPDGSLDLDRISGAIKANDSHFAKSRLLCLENTHHGRVLDPEYTVAAQRLARERGLALHLDGARIWNAVVAGSTSPSELTSGFDTVSVCLSKGLGAPIGSILLGSDELIHRARRWRKMLGGGTRQAGVIAAAGRYAIEHHIDRLADDHANAERLAAGLSDLPGIEVNGAHTNMVFVRPTATDPFELCRSLKDDGIVITPGPILRLVCHLDVSTEDVEHTVACFRRRLV